MQPQIPEKGLNTAAVTRHIAWTWLQTFLGFALLGGLIAFALSFVGLHWSLVTGILCVWIAFPIIGWYNSASLVLKLMRCREPNPANPNHMRLVRIVDELFPKTGLTYKPPVYISPIPLPNAFATGRNQRHAFIAATEGLLRMRITDAELEAVLAHELAHVKSRDVTITSLAAILGSLFSVLLATGLPGFFRPVFEYSDSPLVDDLSENIRDRKKKFFDPTTGFVGFAVMLVIFYVVSVMMKFLALFVGRTRESAADAMAAKWTRNPCALSTALQKISNYIKNRGASLRLRILTRGMTPVLLVNPLLDDDDDAMHAASLGARLGKWWRHLGENHPSVEDRLAMLDRMSGRTCPRIDR